MYALVRPVALAFAGVMLWAACGGDDGDSEDPAALCKQGCNKIQTCFGDAGGPTIDCEAQCAPRDGGTGGGSTCTNQADIDSASRACLDKPCAEFISCFARVPACQRGTGGTGGAGGTGGGGTGGGGTGGAGTGGGGTGGTGGTSGGGTCADLLACCNAAATDALKTECRMLYDAAMPSGDMFCGAALSAGKSRYCP
jgi:hypothetical protein